ncbi:hypothetical protein DFH08DRAFT_1024478 [Mycena albidolilacea]|uniref:Myb/SANT-like domain-containing protein n=1 Tax=Mycena albidolilacea TaxID=1033008 RepID=A0AAD7ALC7_9AGAR|nr:hypothetical protein DFH08DRAFT_1024478 [Mycena albidolilacea]
MSALCQLTAPCMPPKHKNTVPDPTAAQPDPAAAQPPTTGKARVRWTSADDVLIVATLTAAKANGLQADSGWKPVLKKDFKDVQGLRDLSGFGWDDGLKMFTATDAVWDDLLKRHPEHERWRTSSFSLYDDILHLVDGIIATGAGAFHAGSTTSAGPSTPPEAPTTPSGKDKDVEIVMTPVVDPDDDLAPSSPIRPRMRKRAASSSPSTTTPTITKKSR